MTAFKRLAVSSERFPPSASSTSLPSDHMMIEGLFLSRSTMVLRSKSDHFSPFLASG